MKKLLFTIAFSFLALTLTWSQSANDIQEIIIGEWEVIDFEINTKNINPEILKEGKELALTSSFSFKKNGVCSSKNSLEELEGTWEYKDDNREIYLQYPESEYSKHAKYILTKYNKDLMIWKSDYGEYGYTAMKLIRKQVKR